MEKPKSNYSEMYAALGAKAGLIQIRKMLAHYSKNIILIKEVK